MSKVSFSSLKLKVNTDVTKFNFNANVIEVLKYLPWHDKYDLVMITLQKSEEDGTYNELKLDMYFHLHLVYMYTNLTFTEKQKEDEEKIYDSLMSSGFIDEFLKVFNESEYNQLWNMIISIADTKSKYLNSAGGILRGFVKDLPTQAQAVKEIVDSFDPKKYQNVINFAKAVGANN